MQVRDAERLMRQIDALHARAEPRHRFGQDAAAAADVEHALAGEVRVVVDPAEPDRIQFVQRLELGIRVPPAMREIAEFLEFVGIGVRHVGAVGRAWRVKEDKA